MLDARDGSPAMGLYEQLITLRLQKRLAALEGSELRAIERAVGGESAPHVLARHVAETVRDVLQRLPESDRVHAANHILEAVGTLPGAREWVDLVATGPRQLLALAKQQAPGVYEIRPATPLSDTALLTNSPEDPSLGFELRAELATANRVDLLCAFVKWHGIRLLEDSLRAARERGVPVRVITTTYMGATEQRALDRLVDEFGAEVKVNYEIRSTRLHAKAWLFRRDSGYDTAYVGSSNLSRAALVDGLEWNVRLSSVATPDALKKFEATFDSYWSEAAFKLYDPATDAEQLQAALEEASGKSRDGIPKINLSGLDVRPYPHQQEMLELLELQRTVHDRHRNLLVAATGTGKTIMAALDYKGLLRNSGKDLRLLFVAHRKEILTQSQRAFQEVLNNGNFGEQMVDGRRPKTWNHVFASVQALTAGVLDGIDPKQFDVIVIDEFHHGTAESYRRIFNHFSPSEFLALTATPERTDGVNIQDEFFEGEIAAEMRLWEAFEKDLLTPFHYFGIADTTDLTTVRWSRGAYDRDALSGVLTGNVARARIILKAVKDKLSDPQHMRALGFCVTIEHAKFMAECFQQANIKAVALSGETPRDLRKKALDDLVRGDLQVIFSVDLFNEGLDVPSVDTLLLLRPTSSATLFLQQLGRGLRRCDDKAVLTVLDFIGQHRQEFRFENQFRALTNLSRQRLVNAIESDFPRLPSGCAIILETQSKDRILGNIRRQVEANINQLAKEVREYEAGAATIAGFLRESGRDISDLYRSNRTWTTLLRRAGVVSTPKPEGETELMKRVSAFLHVDDPVRAEVYSRLLMDDAPLYEELSEREKAFARMMFFNFWPTGSGFTSYERGLASLQQQVALRDEVRQVLAYGQQHLGHVTSPLDRKSIHTSPLQVHASYNRSEILSAIGDAALGGHLPGNSRDGVCWCPETQTDALLITLEKDEKDFSPQTRYKDYAINDSQFHWESQGRTSESSSTGLRYQQHKAMGSDVLLFVRRFKYTDGGRPQPWMLLGKADYNSHEGSNPMGIVWDLHTPLPADVHTYSVIAAS
jgi:superfamily II DNA or RNA helicase/HKD family nuclease